LKVKIIKNSGIHLIADDVHVVIDPTSVRAANEADLILISHAHSDHHPSSLKNVTPLKLMSEPTYLLLSNKKKGPISHFHLLKPFQTPRDEFVFEKNGDAIRIQAHPAGHVVGSMQFLISFNGEKVIYTGDFCLDDRCGMEKSMILQAENGTLIIDSTYFDKVDSFPSRKRTYVRLLRWLHQNFKKPGKKSAVIIAQRLGTCQEIAALINNYSTIENYKIHVHAQVFESNLVHAKFSSLQYFYKKRVFEEESRNTCRNQSSLTSFFETEMNNGSGVSDGNGNKRFIGQVGAKLIFLLPFNYVRKIQELVEFYGADSIAVCTGWAETKMFKPLETEFGIQLFPLTSHAARVDIQRYEKESKAKKVIYV